MKYAPHQWHDYHCNRKEADKLVKWLMDKGYWIEIAYRGEELWIVQCAVSLQDLPPNLNRMLD